jgi:hypothetical protein
MANRFLAKATGLTLQSQLLLQEAECGLRDSCSDLVLSR